VAALALAAAGALGSHEIWAQNAATRGAASGGAGASAKPTFYREVLPILQQHCESCHRAGGIAPMAFETYEGTRPYAEAIRRATQDKSMPPWFAAPGIGRFSNDPSMTPAHWTDADVLLVYAPGSSPDEWPATMAKFIPAGSALVFQMHYTTSGHAGVDQTSVGLVFAKQPPAQRVLTLQLTNDHFVIPPGVPDYRVEARGTLPNDALLLSLFPHMHLRGKRFEYNILNLNHLNAEGRNRKNGEPGASGVETLLRVNYHFHWQMSYRLAEPRLLKAGTELQAVAWYDNSRNNPHNPDPDAAVRWGEQTYDEMMVGFFDVAVAAGLDKRSYFVRH
jgi:mono/diheme cytochrome c family protein